MIERVIENWLTRTNERSLEVPFCQLLASEGYQVIHLTRHGNMEEGKDVLAVDPNGTPCAFQLKNTPNGKFTNSLWEENRDQIIRLIELPIKHPSIDSTLPRRTFLVVNGELDEEVHLEIDGRNSESARRGYPKLEVIVKGQLLERFKRLQSDFWPAQLTFERDLLQLFLADGTGWVNKEKLAGLISLVVGIGGGKGKTNKNLESARAISSAALFTSYALAPYAEKANHVALIEGWTVFVACLVTEVEKHKLKKRYWGDSLAIARFAIRESLQDLWNELRERTHYVEGSALEDVPFYRGRITWLLGLVSLFALWIWFEDNKWRPEAELVEFLAKNQTNMLLWGEAATPHYLAKYWFDRQITPTFSPDFFLLSLVSAFCRANTEDDAEGLADPYHELASAVEEQLNLKERQRPNNPEHYKGHSYMLEGLLHLVVRRGLRQNLRFLLPDISRIAMVEFDLPSSSEFGLWYSKEGTVVTVVPKPMQSWAELQREANSVDLSKIPDIMKDNPELLLTFSLVFPHRVTKHVMKYLDNCMWDLRKSRSN